MTCKVQGGRLRKNPKRVTGAEQQINQGDAMRGKVRGGGVVGGRGGTRAFCWDGFGGEHWGGSFSRAITDSYTAIKTFTQQQKLGFCHRGGIIHPTGVQGVK